MPDAEMSVSQEDQDNHRTGGGKAVTRQHGPFFVPAVAERPGEYAQQHIGRVGADRKQERSSAQNPAVGKTR